MKPCSLPSLLFLFAMATLTGDHHFKHCQNLLPGVKPQHQPQLTRARGRGGGGAGSRRVCPSVADTPQCECSEEPPGLVVACNRYNCRSSTQCSLNGLSVSVLHWRRLPACSAASSTTFTPSPSPPCLLPSPTCLAGSSQTSRCRSCELYEQG